MLLDLKDRSVFCVVSVLEGIWWRRMVLDRDFWRR